MLRRISLSAINATLSLLIKLGLCRELHMWRKSTIGGAINTTPSGILSGAHGRFADAVQQLEIV